MSIKESPTTSISDTIRTISGLTNGVRYYFRVSALDNLRSESAGSYAMSASPSVLNSIGEYNPDTSTVLLLHMDESADTIVSDASGFQNNGTASNAPVASGRFGNCRAFGGNSSSYIQVARATSLEPVSGLTIEYWMLSNGTGAGYWTSLRQAGNCKSGPVVQNVNNLYAPILCGPSTCTGQNIQTTTDVSNHVGKWTHYAFTYDTATGMKSYVNGVLVGTQPPQAYLLSYSGANLFLGGSTQDPGDGGINGLIDEVRISNRARSPQEFNLQLPPVGLSASVSGATVNLSWQNGGGAEPLMRYKIYRGTDSSNVLLVDSTTATSKANTVPGVGSYFYRITAVDSTGFEGAASYAVKATWAGNTPQIILNQTDYRVALKSNVQIQGSLMDSQDQPISNTYIAVNDALKNFSTIVQTDANGKFTYSSLASRIGIYQIYFDYTVNNVEMAYDNALIDVGNNATVSLFDKLEFYNNSAKTVDVNLEYDGPNSASNAQSVTYDKDFTVPAFTTIVLINPENFNFDPNLIEQSNESGPPPGTGSYSIARTLCPIQFGGATGCGPDPTDPNSQVFSASADVNLGIKFQVGLYYDKKDNFGVSLDMGAGIPYIISGSGGLTLGTDGLGLNVAGGIGVSQWTVKVFDSETNTGMDAITGIFNCPIDPLFTDPQGRRIGIDPTTNQVVNEIPYASYTGPSSEPQVINIPSPINGDWDLTTIGRGAGPYTIERKRYFYNTIDQQIINGTSSTDSVKTFQTIIDTIQTTILPPDSITLTIVDSALFVKWPSVPKALYYKVYYGSDSSVIPYNGSNAAQGNSPVMVTAGTHLSLTGLTKGNTYIIAVTSVDSQGTQSYFSKEDSILFDIATDVSNSSGDHSIPTEFHLLDCYPNPFNPSTIIGYDIPKLSHVKIVIYDILGREVEQLVNGERQPGHYQATFNASNLPSGVYFYRLTAGAFTQVRKMLLMK